MINGLRVVLVLHLHLMSYVNVGMIIVLLMLIIVVFILLMLKAINKERSVRNGRILKDVYASTTLS